MSAEFIKKLKLKTGVVQRYGISLHIPHDVLDILSPLASDACAPIRDESRVFALSYATGLRKNSSRTA